VRLKENKAYYANRWINTARLKQEKAYGRPVFAKIGELTGKIGLLTLLSQQFKKVFGLLDLSKGSGQGNTSLVCHGNQLMALHENDMPYILQVLCSGAIETIRRAKFEGKGKEDIPHFTAHPKEDKETGELHFFSYNIRSLPHLTYGVLDRNNRLTKSIPIELPNGPAMMHDMALTRTYAIFLYMPLFFRPKEMMGGHGFPFVFEPNEPSKFALLPRDAEDESSIQWFDLPAGMIFHTANAWEDEDGRVNLYACSTSEYSLGELLSSKSTRYGPVSPTSPQPPRPAGGSLSTSIATTGHTWPAGGSLSTSIATTGHTWGISGRTGGPSMKSVKGGFVPGAHGGISIFNSSMALFDGKSVDGKSGGSKVSMGGTGRGNPASFAVPNKFIRGMSLGNSMVSNFSDLSPSGKRDVLNMSGSEEEGDKFTLFHFVFDPKTGVASQRKLLDPSDCCDAYLLEYPVINPLYLSRANRYVYLATFCDGMKTSGVVKVDLTKPAFNNIAGTIEFGRKRFGGECIFVPREGLNDGSGEESKEEKGKREHEEDDGYLLTIVYDGKVRRSFMLIYCARTMEELAEVDLKCRVPFGFHGLFMSEREMSETRVHQCDDVKGLGNV